MMAQVMLRVVPLLGCLLVSNVGTLISDVLRCLTVYNTACTPVLLPLLIPYFVTGEMEITPGLIGQLVASFLAGGTAVYTAAKNRGFGVRMQGMTVGFMIMAVSSSFISGLIREEWPQLTPVMEWVMSAVGVVMGGIVGSIALKFDTAVNLVATSIIGAYSALLIVASMDLEFTSGLSMSDMASGNMGCTSIGCYGVLVGALLWALLGFCNQMALKDPAALESLENPGCYKRWLKRVWFFLKVWAEPIFTLNEVLIKIGDPEITPEGEKEAIETLKTSVFKLVAFLGNITILSCCACLLISTIELFAMGVYTRTKTMMFLGMLLLLMSLAVVAITLVGISAHLMPEGARAKRWRTKIFLLLAFIAAPCCGFMSVLCFTLGSDEYVNVPWVSEFLGISTESLMAEDSSWSSVDNEYVATAAGTSDQVRSRMCDDQGQGEGCSQMEIQAAVDQARPLLPSLPASVRF